MSAQDQTYPEPLVARVLGPKKPVLVGTRHLLLKKGRDWRLVEGVVCYTREGLTTLCRHLKLDEGPVVAATKNTAGETAAAAAPQLEASAGAGEASLPRTASMMTSSELAQFARRDPAVTVAAAVAEKAAQRELVLVEVTGCSPNPLIVFGTLDGSPVKVRVRNNSTFTRGLVLRAKQSAADPTVYLMIGTPPRWKGDRVGFTRPTPTPESTP